MNRPYVICHMTVSLDGKVTGEEENGVTNQDATNENATNATHE